MESLSLLSYENIIELTLSTHGAIIWVDKVNSYRGGKTLNEDLIKKIRQFNRYYTVWLDVMNKGYLGTNFSWPESRVLFEIYANQGTTMKRIMPRAQGRANRIRKRTSHITVVLKEA